MSPRRFVAVGVVVTLVTGGVLACNGVLGITEASVDPTLGRVDAGTPDAVVNNTDTGAPPDPNSCEAYCTAIDQNCKDTNAEYTNVPTCVKMCQSFEPGKPGEQMNDSRACRMFYTQQAKTTPTTDCQRAGPLGIEKCSVEPCAAFCSLAFNLCSDVKDPRDGTSLFPYKDDTECRTACARWPYLTIADGGAGTVGDILFAAGDTLNCRLYHLESAYEPDNETAAETHCRHISDPSSTCR